jgi:serine/threonine protein kinase
VNDHLPNRGSARAGRDRLRERVQAELNGRYRIEDSIGHGAMAVVFRAQNVELDRWVALKVMRPETGYEDGVVQRFRTEALCMSQLHHPRIVGVHTSGESDNILWFEMDLVEGQSLDKLVGSGPLEPRRVARMVADAADGLHYAHRCGVIHRDIKPANLLVSERTDDVLITDFGIAKIVGANTLTATGFTIGTIAYMSPEQLSLDGELTPATDQYSLGAVAYQMLTGITPPFADPNSWDTATRMAGVLKPVRTLARACPPDLAVLVERMMARVPDDRWADLAVVQRAASEIATTGNAGSLGPQARRGSGGLSAALRRLWRKK